jgi:uncharacterized protein
MAVMLAAAITALPGPTQAFENPGVITMNENHEGVRPEAGMDNAGKAPQPNRLIHEKSPYLLQHAYNPVDWYPWGDEAFEKARKEDKPILLSIGYSTCHWCHVMEHESFEDEEAARALNEAFVSIKVDREERPDIDHIYMTVCQMLTGSGGWPLNIIMTPDKKPFFAGTYFPRESRYGRIGVIDLARNVKEVWTNNRQVVTESVGKVMSALRQVPDEMPGESPGAEELHKAFLELAQRYDPGYGGFGQAPKFPTPHNLLFLLRQWKRSGHGRALEMVEKTLQGMRMGGIHDHVGFGFHRYSTDPVWLVPHFEKMLYDQAMLLAAYTEAFQATGKSEYASTAHEIVTYVLRDMTSPEGGFYSAEDADSEGVEGKFYVWKASEIRHALDPVAAELVTQVFNVKESGNYREEATGHPTGDNILHLSKPLAETAKSLNIAESDLRELLETARKKLFDVREERVHPHKDDKILTDWNGLMIAALAKAAQVFDEPKYAAAASRAADFVLKNLRRPDGRLLHRYRDGNAGLPAHVDDYAFMIWGLLELYETDFRVDRLQTALELNALFLEHFWDSDRGGFFFTADDAENLIMRKKEIYDGAVPSGNSVAALNLLRLGRMTANTDLEKKAEQIGRTFSGNVKQLPSAHTQLLLAIDFGLGPSNEVVVAGSPGGDDTAAMLKALRKPFLPNKVVLFRPGGEPAPPIVSVAPYTANQQGMDGKATAYVCRGYNCELPTTDPDKMVALLAGK